MPASTRWPGVPSAVIEDGGLGRSDPYNTPMRQEMAAMVSLAWPVVLAEIGWVLMGVVDTIVVGPLGPAAIGAVGTGSAIFIAFMVLGMGTLFALDTFVAQSFGANRIDDCHRWLFAGLWLALVMSVVLVGVGLLVVALLPALGLHADVLVLLQPYLGALLWSGPPLLVFTVLRRYLQAMNLVRAIMVAVVVANVVNAVANVVFVYGYLGMPAMGTIGSAYATLGARLCLVVVLGGIVLSRERRRPSGLRDASARPDTARMWQIARLGAPAAIQVALEVGVFAAAATLAGRLSPTALAANQIVLNIASLFFMVPLGLSAAAAIRVGHAVGRRDEHAARRAGWAGLLLALMAAAASATLFLTLPEPLLGVFTADRSVLAVGVTLLFVCAMFQPFDALQVVATGALRGRGDTRTPMLCNLAGHWFIGLPVGYTLCFWQGWGVVGLWAGLSVGIILIGVALVMTWHRTSLGPLPAAEAA
jgi:multidrug resistance protein, MATE family